MAIRTNSGYNNPEFAQAAQSLAQMFGPPSAGELSGYSTARINNQKAKTAEQLAQMAIDKTTFDPQVFDRLNVAGGNYAPTSSYYAQDQNNSTTIRGQDVVAGTSRANNFDDNATAVRGQDVVAGTSRANNFADNQTKLISGLYGPRDPYYTQPALPATIADSFGVPEIPAMSGLPKPQSQTEIMGGQTQRLIADGLLSDEDLKALIMKGSDGSGSTASEDRIARMTENLMSTGTVLDPKTAHDMAVGIVDGRLTTSRHPVTGELQVVDMATGLPAYQAPRGHSGTGDPVVDAATRPDAPKGFGAPYPASDKAFGVGGAAAGAINTVTDTLGLGTAYPDVQATQADFNVLRERLLSDMESAYGGRQPPSWLMQEIRGLTPDAGGPFEGVQQAQAKLTAIGRQMTTQIKVVQQQLDGEISPSRSQALEAELAGLQSSAANIRLALDSFGGSSAPAAPQPDANGWITAPNGARIREIK